MSDSGKPMCAEDALPPLPDDDRREYRRIPARLIAHFRKGADAVGVTSNVSLGGVFIETHMTFAVGEPVSFDLHLVSEKKSATTKVAINGVVRWLGKAPNGVGVEIVRMEVNDRTRMNAYIRERPHTTRTSE